MFFFNLKKKNSFTSIGERLLLNAGSDGFILQVNVSASSDPAENLTSLLATALLEEPARALWKEEESDELHQSRDTGQTQHVPTGQEIEKESYKRNKGTLNLSIDIL